ncbi:MAG: hypothetical protein WD766_02485 [Gemmatimonadota bacterium]
MRSHTPQTLGGLLAIGPHGLDAQIEALTAYAVRTRQPLDVFLAILPGEDPAHHGPRSGFPILVFDDEIAGFTPEEHELSTSPEDPLDDQVTEWHVAHATPRPKRPTAHLPVYGPAAEGEASADAILRVGTESLDRQIARIEAYAMRSAIRLRGVYIATGADNLRVLLRDFSVSKKAHAAGPTLTVDDQGAVEVHF